MYLIFILLHYLFVPIYFSGFNRENIPQNNFTHQNSVDKTRYENTFIFFFICIC